MAIDVVEVHTCIELTANHLMSKIPLCRQLTKTFKWKDPAVEIINNCVFAQQTNCMWLYYSWYSMTPFAQSHLHIRCGETFACSITRDACWNCGTFDLPPVYDLLFPQSCPPVSPPCLAPQTSQAPLTDPD